MSDVFAAPSCWVMKGFFPDYSYAQDRYSNVFMISSVYCAAAYGVPVQKSAPSFFRPRAPVSQFNISNRHSAELEASCGRVSRFRFRAPMWLNEELPSVLSTFGMKGASAYMEVSARRRRQ